MADALNVFEAFGKHHGLDFFEEGAGELSRVGLEEGQRGGRVVAMQLLQFISHQVQLPLPSCYGNPRGGEVEVSRQGEIAGLFEHLDELPAASRAIFRVGGHEPVNQFRQLLGNPGCLVAQILGSSLASGCEPLGRVVSREGRPAADAPGDRGSKREEIASSVGMGLFDDLGGDKGHRAAGPGSDGGRLQLAQAKVDELDLEGARDSIVLVM